MKLLTAYPAKVVKILSGTIEATQIIQVFGCN